MFGIVKPAELGIFLIERGGTGGTGGLLEGGEGDLGRVSLSLDACSLASLILSG